jgi:MFS family permease
MGVEQVPTDTIGLVLAMYAIGMLLGGRFSRHLIQRVGHIRVFAACASLGAMAILACALYVNPWLWGAMRLLMGFCLACAFAVIDGWLSDVASESMRGRILASSQVTIMAAVLISQFLINLAPIETQTLFILAGMLLCFSLLPLVMSRRTAPIVQASSRMSYAQLARLSPLGVVGCFFAGLLYGSLMNMLPIFAGHYALSGMLLSLFMASAVLGAFILQFPIGMLADKFDRRTVLLGLLSITLISSLSVPVLAHFDVFLGLLLLTAITTRILS